MRQTLCICLCSVLLLSCNETPEVLIPNTSADVLLSETKPITPVMRSSIEGIYNVLNGSDAFGKQVALKWSYEVSENLADTTFTLSVFSGLDACYFAMEGGTLDSMFVFTGYWRKMVSTETGLVRCVIPGLQGGHRLFGPNPVIGKDSITFEGTFGTGQGIPDKRLTLRYDRPLSTAKRFEVLAHRGGGRTADLLPVSENSVEMILFTPRLGSTGIEIDVRFTKDGVPILYHDSQLNSRLTQKTGLVGTIEEYTYNQLQAFVRLIHGERIPTLDKVLEAALYRTPIRSVYIDTKATAYVPQIRTIQKKYMGLATAAGREFDIYIGIPSDEVLNKFLELPDYAEAPSLCELSLDDYHKAKSTAWAPRWTLGTQMAEVGQVHGEGHKVFTWTMDVASWVQTYIQTGDFDGMVTNYAPMVAYYNYAR